MPKLSILIVNFNGLVHLPDCLGSIYSQFQQLEEQGIVQPGDLNVILVDNASKDGSLHWLRQNFPQVHIVQSTQNLGFAGGNNLGFPHCQGEWIFLLNNDTILEAHCIRSILQAIDQDQGDILACLMTDFQRPDLVDSAGDTFYRAGPTFSRKHISTTHPLFHKPSPVFSACAGACVIRQQVLKQIGTFDEDLFLNFEDVDLSLRARHAGYRITLIPAAKVRHKGSATIGRYTRTSVYYSVRNQFLVRIKNYPASVLIRSMPGLIVTAILSLIKTTHHGGLKWWIEARAHQIAMLPHFCNKRKSILANSTWNAPDFYQWLRPNWFKDYRKRQKKLPLDP